MSNHKMTCGLVVFCAAAVFVAGCIPEDSLEWSDDGSVGLLRIDGALYLVDGNTGELTEVAKANVGVLPDISRDGNLIAYSEEVDCDSLSKGLGLLPPGQVKMIEHFAGQMKKKVLDTYEQSREVVNPFQIQEGDPPHENCLEWAVRYLCENADNEFARILGPDKIEEGRKKSISYFQVVVAPRENPAQKHIVTANVLTTMATQLSPDGKLIAYLMETQEGKPDNVSDGYGLYVASLKGGIKGMLVGHSVAAGYDWREDAKAIAYLESDSEYLGSLKERVIADANGNLFAKQSEVPEQGAIRTHNCTHTTKILAGVFFYPWQKVRYGSGGRIFFSSCVMSLPTTNVGDDPIWSLFCYDSVTGTVTDVLPQCVSYHTSQAISMSQFALSPDGKRVLLPIKYNRFVGYDLGGEDPEDSMGIPIEEDEGFGEEDGLDLAPSWKGNNEISFLVSENSHFLPKAEEGKEKNAREEIVILNTEDGQSRILSGNWPDEIMGGSKDDQKQEEQK